MENDIKNVINNNCCVGCGACAVQNDKAFRIELDQYGLYKSIIINDESDVSSSSKVCPFSNNSFNEDHLAAQYFSNCENYDNKIGFFRSLYAGYVKEGEYRSIATSGGVISWILCELKRINKIDYVIHVKKCQNDPKNILFKYSISESEEEIKNGAKSRYYPVQISEVMQVVKNKPGSYAFVGVPCFIKAVRLLMAENQIFKKRIKYCVGLVCGHLKSTEFSKFFAWQAGIHPSKLEDIDFRIKLGDKTADDYGVYLKSDSKKIIKRTKDFFGYNWGYNFFRNPACNYCDDVFSETADMVVGDAWLPEYIHDTKGCSVIAVRNQELDRIIKEAIKDKRLSFDKLDRDKFIASQIGGIRDRREGLAYRLFLKKQENKWVPQKRVQPSDNINSKRKNIYKLRWQMQNLSHEIWLEAVRHNSYDLFQNKMQKYVDKAKSYHKASPIKIFFNVVLITIKNPKKVLLRLLSEIKHFMKRLFDYSRSVFNIIYVKKNKITVISKLFLMSKRGKKIYLFGCPFHPNLGDLAQTMCIEQWFSENYADYKLVKLNKATSFPLALDIINRKINRDDKIFFHSGYHIVDHHPDLPHYCEIIKKFPDHKIIIFPQTVNLHSKNKINEVAKAFNAHKNLSIMCRDKVSYNKARQMFINSKLLLVPDIVTTLIGSRDYNSKREGVLFLMRDDIEAYYTPEQINILRKKFEPEYKTTILDTTLKITTLTVEKKRDQLIEEFLNDVYSKYQLVITDRYHGAIFSLVTNTPVVVLNSMDHKLSSGVDWFPAEFSDYIVFADDIDKAYSLGINMLKKKRRKKLSKYFSCNYYADLKEKL